MIGQARMFYTDNVNSFWSYKEVYESNNDCCPVRSTEVTLQKYL